MSDEQVVETGVVASGTSAKPKRRNVPRDTFVVIWNKSASAIEAAEKAGMNSAQSATARASKHRGEGFILKHMPQGGGAKLDPEVTLQLCADSLGMTIEDVRAQSAKQIAETAKRKADRAAAKAGK